MIPKEKYITLSKAARELLASMQDERHSDGLYVRMLMLPTSRVSVRVYAELKRALLAMGGVYVRNNFEFPKMCLSYSALRKTIQTGKALHLRESSQFFPTPPLLAETISKFVTNTVKPGVPCRILEPSAGDGALIRPLIRARIDSRCIVAVEIDPIRCASLRSEFPDLTVIHDDFDKADLCMRYAAVLMNPPYSGNLWQKHILKAITLLSKPTGFLVAIVPRFAKLDFLKKAGVTNAMLTPVEADFEHTDVEVSVLTINIPAKVVRRVLKPLSVRSDTDEVSAIDEDYEPIKAPGYYLKLIRQDLDEAMANLDALEKML